MSTAEVAHYRSDQHDLWIGENIRLDWDRRI